MTAIHRWVWSAGSSYEWGPMPCHGAPLEPLDTRSSLPGTTPW